MLILTSPPATAAGAATAGVTEYPLPESACAQDGIWDMTVGPDGNVWFAGCGGAGRVTADGTVTLYDLRYQARGIASGPDGALWLNYGLAICEPSPPSYLLGRITTEGVTSDVSGRYPTGGEEIVAAGGALLHPAYELDCHGGPGGMALTRPVLARTMPDGSGQAFPLSDWQRGPGLTHYASLALGSDGAVWMTQVLGVEEAILRVGPDGAVTRFPLPAGTTALEIAFGPDGAVWFSASGARIGRMTTGGAVTVAPASPPPWNTSVRDLARGPDPAIYFTVGRHREVGYVGRVTPGGSTSRLLLPEVGALTTGPDGALWIAGYLRIFRVSPEAVVAPRFSSGVTMARSSFRVGAGSSFRFSLSKAAKVTIAIEMRISARRWAKAGRTLRRSGLQRTNQMPFDGRVGRRALPPGVYRARLRATDASGNRSGERRVRFRILRD